MKLRLVLMVWITVLVSLSLSPVTFKLRFHIHGPLHDWSHYLVFAVTAILIWLISPSTRVRILGFVSGFGLAVLQEWAENRIYHAGFEYKDVASDFAGLVTGMAIMMLAGTLMQNQHRSASPRDY